MLVVALAACTAPDPARGHSVTWSQMRESGWGGDSQTVVFLSTPADAGSTGFLGFIDDAGDTKFLRTDPLDGGQVASRDGVLCGASSTTSYKITHSTARRSERAGEQWLGHWTGVRVDGSCVYAFNDGNTDVFWDSAGHQRHSVVPVTPGPIGLTSDAVWASDDGSTDDGDVTLYRTDLATGKTTRAMGWQPWQDLHHGSGPELTYSAGYASNLFPYRGKLFFLEDQLAMDKGGDLAEIRPGVHAQLRLAELDPQRGRYTSTFLELTPSGMTDTAQGDVSIPAAGMSGGHRWGHSLYTGDAQGNILAVDLRTKQLRSIGHVSDAAMRAHNVVAAWNEGALTLVVLGQTGKVTLEKYDLTSGRRASTQSVTGFGPLIDNDLAIPDSAAALR